MDIATSVLSTKTAHSAATGKGGLGADDDAPAQGRAFEDEVAALRDESARDGASANGASPKAENGADPRDPAEPRMAAEPEDAVSPEAAPDAATDIAIAEGATPANLTAGNGAVSASVAVRPALSDDLGPAQKSVSQAATVDTNAVSAAGVATTNAQAGEVEPNLRHDPNLPIAAPRTESSGALIGTVAVSGGAHGGDALVSSRTGSLAASTRDVGQLPLSGSPAGTPRFAAIAEDSGAGATGRAPQGEGTDAKAGLPKPEYTTRAIPGWGESAPMASRAAPPVAPTTGPELPAASVLTQSAPQPSVSADRPTPQSVVTKGLAAREDGPVPGGKGDPPAATYRGSIDGWAAARVTSPAPTAAEAVGRSGSTGGTSATSIAAPAAFALPSGFAVIGPAFAPLFGAQAALGRDGLGDAAFAGGDFALLEQGRSVLGQHGAMPAIPAEPRHVARQIAEALVAARENGIDLQLSPEELGRVKLSITQGEAGLLVTVSADRPETLDLLRRHIDLLGEEFSALGLGETAFSFSDSQGNPEGSPAGQDLQAAISDTSDLKDGQAPETEASLQPAPQTRRDTGSLDIRL